MEEIAFEVKVPDLNKKINKNKKKIIYILFFFNTSTIS